MTASLFDESWEQCRAAGMDDLLVKPFVMDELLRVLMRWIKPRGSVTEGNRDGSRHPFGACPQTGANQWPEEPWADLDALPGVAARSAVDRLEGDHALYRRMAVRFRDEHADCTRLIRDARAAGRIDEAVMTAHRLKGATAHLGFAEASRLAGDIEPALRHGQGDVSPLLRDLDQHLAPIFTILARALPPTAGAGAGPAPGRSLDTAAAVSLAREILTGLDHNYALAAKKIAALSAMPLPPDIAPLAGRIVEHLDDFEPDPARPLLERLIAKLQRGDGD